MICLLMFALHLLRPAKLYTIPYPCALLLPCNQPVQDYTTYTQPSNNYPGAPIPDTGYLWDICTAISGPVLTRPCLECSALDLQYTML